MQKLKKITFIFIVSSLLTAFEVGEYAELDQLMNGRSEANFQKTAENIKYQVPKGSVGKIVGLKKFATGNYGVQMELQNFRKGETAWVYFTPKVPNMKFFKENPLIKVKASVSEDIVTATHAQVTRETIAVKSPSAKQQLSQAAVQMTEASAKLDIKARGGPNSQDYCALCSIGAAALESAASCPDRRSQVGGIWVRQGMSEGSCEVAIYPDEGFKKISSRQYNFKSDGMFELVEDEGARAFYLFPRTGKVSYSLSADGKSVVVQTSANTQFEISGQSGKVTQVSGVKSWSESSAAAGGPKRMFQILPNSESLVLDLQYRSGGNPERNKRGSALLLKGDGTSCKIPNSSLFDYKYDGVILDTAKFKFSKDADFSHRVVDHCGP